MTIAKRRGRPPLDPTSSLPSSEVRLTLAAKDYDRVRQVAARERASVQDVLRRCVRRLLSDTPRASDFGR